MSRYDYQASKQIPAGTPFYALIMAAMRQADTSNLGLLTACWPEVYGEFQARYNAPAGLLDSDPLPERQQVAAELAAQSIDPDIIRIITGVTPGE